MDADILKVYKRLADRWPVSYCFRYEFKPITEEQFKQIKHIKIYRQPYMCTAELTTFLKETNTHGN